MRLKWETERLAWHLSLMADSMAEAGIDLALLSEIPEGAAS
jgi:hypothetical protein